MFGWSLPTIVIIGIIVFIIFGAGKLPEIGSGMGKAIKNFKSSLSGKDEIDVTPAEKHEAGAKTAQKRKKIASSSDSPSETPKKRKKTPASKKS